MEQMVEYIPIIQLEEANFHFLSFLKNKCIIIRDGIV